MASFVKTLVGSASALCFFCVAAFAQSQPQPYYTGDGGKGIRLAVLELAGKGLSADEQWMLSLVQGSVAGDFNKFSAMTIIDRQNLEKIFAEWKESMSGSYSDADRVKIGNLTNASHILTGSISKTASAFMLELTVTDVASGVRRASYSPTPVSPAALENLSAIKAASADLLRQLGVGLTGAALGELRQTANSERILAETMLARGIAAQRQGTEVAALSYFFQAAAFDSSLVEASSRSLVMAADISSGSIGADARNDIAWRKKWIARLKETEEAFYKMINAADPPYALSYSTNIRKGNIDYERETLDLGIDIILSANKPWFNALNRSLGAAEAVLEGLNGTNRKNDWELGHWPWNGVSEKNPFSSYSKTGRYDIAVVFELVNERGRAIGSRTVELSPYFGIGAGREGIGMIVEFTEKYQESVKFNGVKADDISDGLTIRIASVNGGPPQNARFTIGAIAVEAREALVDVRDGKKYNTVRIGGKTWMGKNLNYQSPTGRSWCYDNKSSNCDEYGRLYAFGPAEAVCPAGWRLPTRQEWKELVDAAGGAYAGKNLKSGNYDGGTDMFGFSALFGGYGYDSRGTYRFSDIGREGYWWTATVSSGGKAYSRRINYNEGAGEIVSDMDYGLSVRCVQDIGYVPGEMESGYASAPASAPQLPSTGLAAAIAAKKRAGYAAVSEPATERQQPAPVASYPRVDGSDATASVSQGETGASVKSSKKTVGATPFNPSAVYLFSGMSTIDSHGSDGKERRGGRFLGGVGGDLHGNVETRSTFGMGLFLGGGTYGNGIGSFVIGLEFKNLFWIVKRHLAVPVSIGIDMQTLYSDIEMRTAAGFIDAMGASDRTSDAKMDMYLNKWDLRPTVGLQVFITRKFSICAGYAYNLNIFPPDWYVYYKVPGKSYGADDKGDKFDVPQEHSPLQGMKESFLGAPGALRVSLNIHVL